MQFFVCGVVVSVMLCCSNLYRRSRVGTGHVYDMYNPWSPIGLYQREAHKNCSMVIPEKAAPVSLTTLGTTTVPVPMGFRL